MAVHIFHPEVALIGHTVLRNPEPSPERWTDARGDAGMAAATAGRMCFDASTEILTDQGWRRFPALTRGERVATLNAETWNIEYHRPTDYFEYDCDEPLFIIASPYVNLAVTGEHWLYVAGSGERGFRLRRTAEAAARSLRFLRGGHWHGERPGRASGVGEIVEPRVRLSGSPGGGRAASPALGVRARSVPLAPFLAFLGRYLATGVCYAPPGGPGRVVMPQSAATLESIGACGFHARTRRGRVLIEDAPLYDYLGGLGEIHSKRIPRALLDLDAESLGILRDALFQGRRRFSTPSPQLAGDVQELLLKTGASGNGSQTRPGRYAVDTVEGWTPLVRRGPRLDTAPAGGRVWCLTVPNHIIYVRREGIPVWVGNCHASAADAPARGAGGLERGGDGRGGVTLAIRGVSDAMVQDLARQWHFSFSRLSQGCAEAGAAPLSAAGGPRARPVAAGGTAATDAAVGAPVQGSGGAARMEAPCERRCARPGGGVQAPRLGPGGEARFAVTGDLRTWAGFVEQRSGTRAEPEIRQLALRVASVLQQVSPDTFGPFRRACAPWGREGPAGRID